MRALLSSLLVFALHMRTAESILPNAGVIVETSTGSSETMLATHAYFGKVASMDLDKNKVAELTLPPPTNDMLCQNVTSPSPSFTDKVILVGRGVCTFETKAMNAQRLGASSVLIYGTLGGRYFLNKTDPSKRRYGMEDIIYPREFWDYDCDKGHADIPMSALDFSPSSLPYNSAKNDPILSGDSGSNLCMDKSFDSLQECPSKACLLTGNITTDGNYMKACCAWDLHIELYRDDIFGVHDVNITTMYITMTQGAQLLQELNRGPVQVQLFLRYRPEYSLSSILIWALGVFVAGLAAYYSSGDYRFVTRELIRRRHRQHDSTAGTEEDGNESVPLAPGAVRPFGNAQQEESLELSPYHAIGFIVLASSGLLILFYFKVRD